jgi:hypothetical protein
LAKKFSPPPPPPTHLITKWQISPHPPPPPQATRTWIVYRSSCHRLKLKHIPVRSILLVQNGKFGPVTNSYNGLPHTQWSVAWGCIHAELLLHRAAFAVSMACRRHCRAGFLLSFFFWVRHVWYPRKLCPYNNSKSPPRNYHFQPIVQTFGEEKPANVTEKIKTPILYWNIFVRKSCRL